MEADAAVELEESITDHHCLYREEKKANEIFEVSAKSWETGRPYLSQTFLHHCTTVTNISSSGGSLVSSQHNKPVWSLIRMAIGQ